VRCTSRERSGRCYCKRVFALKSGTYRCVRGCV
jgi:hypothetical protein